MCGVSCEGLYVGACIGSGGIGRELFMVVGTGCVDSEVGGGANVGEVGGGANVGEVGGGANVGEVGGDACVCGFGYWLSKAGGGELKRGVVGVVGDATYDFCCCC